LYKRYRFDEPWNGPHNKELATSMPAVYRCPSSTRDLDKAALRSQTAYAMIVGPHAISDGPTPRTLRDVKDDPFCTILVAECAGAGIQWLEPRDLDVRKMTYQVTYPGDEQKAYLVEISSSHPNVANMLFCDGSVRSVPNDIAPKRLQALTTIDGGEPVTADN
jgi:prepilin-type processing-associated H-X9-DG protein